jgi:hypothetical protein
MRGSIKVPHFSGRSRCGVDVLVAPMLACKFEVLLQFFSLKTAHCRNV